MVAFRFKNSLLALLRRESKKTSINQTRIVEIALSQYFAVKRG
jgi:hypothetical protein